jgi:hypothetical protein
VNDYDFVLEFGDAAITGLAPGAGDGGRSHEELRELCSTGRESRQELLDPRCTIILPTLTRGLGLNKLDPSEKRIT